MLSYSLLQHTTPFHSFGCILDSSLDVKRSFKAHSTRPIYYDYKSTMGWCYQIHHSAETNRRTFSSSVHEDLQGRALRLAYYLLYWPGPSRDVIWISTSPRGSEDVRGGSKKTPIDVGAPRMIPRLQLPPNISPIVHHPRNARER